MTQYLMSVWMVEGTEPPSVEEMEQIYKDVDAFNEEIKAAGHWVFAGGLHPATTTTARTTTADPRGETRARTAVTMPTLW